MLAEAQGQTQHRTFDPSNLLNEIRSGRMALVAFSLDDVVGDYPQQPALLLIMLLGATVFVVGRVVQVNAYQPLLEHHGFALGQHGLIMSAMTIVEAIGSSRTRWLDRWFNPAGAMLVATLGVCVSLVMFGFGPWTALAGLMLFAWTTGLGYPLQKQLINDAIPDSRLRATLLNTRKLIRAQFGLNLFQRGFSQLSLLVPAVVLAADVLGGRLEVGQAVQAGGAFAAVLGAVSLIIDNFESLSRFVAGIDRLHVMAEKLEAEPPAAGIELQPAQDLKLSKLTVKAPDSDRVLVQDLSLSVPAGESLLITGASGSGKSSLLRAIAGLWTQGSGRIHQPPQEDVFFLPQRPYLQTGKLRSQLIYHSTHTELHDEALLKVLD